VSNLSNIFFQKINSKFQQKTTENQGQYRVRNAIELCTRLQRRNNKEQKPKNVVLKQHSVK